MAGTETWVTESGQRNARSWLLCNTEHFMTGLDIFVVSFGVAFIVVSDRFKVLLAALGRLIR